MFDFKKNKKEDADASNEKNTTFVHLEGEASDLDPSLRGNPEYMLALGEKRYVAIKPNVKAQLEMQCALTTAEVALNHPYLDVIVRGMSKLDKVIATGSEAYSEVELEVARRTWAQLERRRQEVEEKLEASSGESIDRLDEDLTKIKSKDALGVGAPPTQSMSFEDIWDMKSPRRTVQSQSPGKVTFGAHRNSTHYPSEYNMPPRTPFGGGRTPQSHQDFDP